MEPTAQIRTLSILTLVAFVSFAAISSQSLWIDEANSAIKAIAPDWQGFVSLMSIEKGSDLQMPLYMALLWLWEKVAGPSEFALRSLNIPLFALAIVWAARRTQLSPATRIWFIVLACVSPMVWAYLDEARPYILQFFGGALVMSSLVNLSQNDSGVTPKTGEAFAAAMGAFILCGASLLGVIFTFFLGMAFLILWVKAESPRATICRPSIWIILVLTGIGLGCLGLYYVWTLTVGARASSVGRTNLLSLIFCAYELFGFTGVGPGRTDLRAAGASSLVPYTPGLIAFCVTIGLWMLACFPSFRALAPTRIRKYSVVIVSVIASLATVVVLGVATDFRVLGRHLMPLMPFGLLLVAALSASSFAQTSFVRRLGILLLPIAMLLSALIFRFSPAHAKDDYRGAAAIAESFLKQGKVVWWAADKAGANYYSLYPIALEGEAVPLSGENLFFANSRSAEYLHTLPIPHLVILSKTNIYDQNGALQEYLQSRQFQVRKHLPAMTFWACDSIMEVP